MHSLEKKDHWDYKTRGKPTHPEIEERITDSVVVGNCCVCGEEVRAYDPHFLRNAGEIRMSFGYGSCRDLDSAYGFVHDYCSFILDQIMTKRRLFWHDCLGGPVHPLDFEKSGVKSSEWVFDKGKSDSTDPQRRFRATMDDLQGLLGDSEEATEEAQKILEEHPEPKDEEE